MKKFVSLVLALSIMMMTMVFVPMGVSATSAFYLFDDFDDSTTIDSTKWMGQINKTDYVNIADGAAIGATGNVIEFGDNSYNHIGTNCSEALTTGFLNVNFDLYLASDWSNELNLYINTNRDSQNMLFYIQKKDNDLPELTLSDISSAITMTKGAWNNIDYKVNLQTGAVAVTVTDSSGASTTKSGTYTDADKLALLESVESVHLIKMYTGTGTYIDNILMQQESYGLLIYDNFDNSTIDTTKWDVLNKDVTAIDETYGAVKISNTENYKGFGFTLPETMETGSINIKYDLRIPSTNTGKPQLALCGADGNSDNNIMMWLIDGVVKYPSLQGNIFTPAADKWYTIEVTMDIESLTMCTLVTEKETGAEVAIANIPTTTKTALANTSKICFGGKYMTSGDYVLIDNVSVTKEDSLNFTLPIEDDFTDSVSNYKKWNIYNTEKFVHEDGALRFNTSAYATFGVDLGEELTDGNIEYKFDIKIPTDMTAGEFYVITGPSGASESTNSIIRCNSSNGNYSLLLRGTKILGLEKGTWYTVCLTYKCDDVTTCTAVAFEKENPSNSGKVTNPATAMPTGSTQIMSLGVKAGVAGNGFLIDNVEINHTDNLLPVKEEFDCGALNTALWDNVKGGTNVSVVDGAAQIGNVTNGAGLGLNLEESITTGKIRANYDVYITESFMNQTEEKTDSTTGGTTKSKVNAEFIFYAGESISDTAALTWLRPNGCSLSGLGVVFYPTVNTWYNFDMVFDVKTAEASLVVTNKTTNETYTKSGSTGRTLNPTNQFNFGGKYMNAGTTSYLMVDNVSFDKVISFDSASFVKYDDTTSTSLENVSAGTKEITVTFDGDMTGKTLDKDTVKLVNTKTNAVIDYTGSLSADGLTWIIPVADYLDASTTYQIILATITGGAVEDTIKFTTDAGEYKIASIKAYNGETEVTELSQIADNDMLTIKANVINTTGNAQDLLLIYAGYNGDEIANCAVSQTKSILATQKNVEISDITVKVDTDDLTKIKLFGWDNAMNYLTIGENVID